jgi:hypothetical protein
LSSTAAIDGLQGLKYVKGKDKVLLVRPSTGIVVDEVECDQHVTTTLERDEGRQHVTVTLDRNMEPQHGTATVDS